MALTSVLGTSEASLAFEMTAGFNADTSTIENPSSTLAMTSVATNTVTSIFILESASSVMSLSSVATLNLEISQVLESAMTLTSVATFLAVPDAPVPPLIIVDGKVQQGNNIKQSGVRHTRFTAVDYTVTADDSIIVCTAALTITLIDAALVFGKEYDIKSRFAGTIIVDGDGSQLIDDDLIQSLTTKNDSITVSSIGTGWIIL